MVLFATRFAKDYRLSCNGCNSLSGFHIAKKFVSSTFDPSNFVRNFAQALQIKEARGIMEYNIWIAMFYIMKSKKGKETKTKKRTLLKKGEQSHLWDCTCWQTTGLFPYFFFNLMQRF